MNSVQVSESATSPLVSAGGFTIRPLGGALGAEIVGVDVGAGLSDAQAAGLREALNTYSVLLFRGQEVSPARQIEFSDHFGPRRPSAYNAVNKYSVDGYPDVVIVSNIKENGRNIGVSDAGMIWHTDASYMRTPDMYTTLFSVKIPQKDGKVLGNTLFVSTAAAYDALPDDMKQRLQGLKSIHSFLHHLAKKDRLGNLTRAPLTEEQKAELPGVAHPIVRTHPITGRKCLFVTEGHTERVVGLSEEESDALLQQLWAHIAQDRFMYKHNWRVGDVLIWDNIPTQHLAVFDYGDIPRLIHRTAIAGPEPV